MCVVCQFQNKTLRLCAVEAFLLLFRIESDEHYPAVPDPAYSSLFVRFPIYTG